VNHSDARTPPAKSSAGEINVSNDALPELGCYCLPGHTRSPADLLGEVRDAERLGLGSAWISERFDVKEAGVCLGAAGAITERIYLGTAATNVNTRHPVLTATLGASVSRLTGGRFALGVARGVGIRSTMFGIGNVTNDHLRDFVDLMKRLWRGERVGGYAGLLGEMPYVYLADWLDEDIPILFCGFGAKSLEFAGSVFDGVILHTFLSDEALTNAANAVRRGAERAGRDPASVKVWSVLATVHEPSEEMRLRYLVARMATYLQAPIYGELLVAANGWDQRTLDAFREHPLVAGMRGAIDGLATLDELGEIERLIPKEWLPAAVGSAEQCARRIVDQFRAGADGVILHASKASELAPVLPAYRRVRDAARFARRTNRPV
jgi:5,10-methylenetetrahydromethanopterin reductase